MSTTTTERQVCADCGGPVRQAFPTTPNYVACRRCGHVFPAERFVCKTCGAETPTGIGYAVTGAYTAPAPAPGCPGTHKEEK